VNFSTQVEFVLVGEFAETLQIQLVEKVGGGAVDHIIFDADFRGHTSLEITHAGDQVQQLQSSIERAAMRWIERRRSGENDTLDQLGAIVERVTQLRLAAARIETATDKTKGRRLAWIIQRHKSLRTWKQPEHDVQPASAFENKPSFQRRLL